jgi:two-component system, NarL family, invasion response regulator UvrY
MIRVAIVDDHDVVRMGIKLMLEQDPEFRVVAEGRTGEDALQIARREQCDVMLLDLNMPEGMSGFEAFDRMMQAGRAVKVVVLTQHEDLLMLRKMLGGGATGYLSKASSGDEVKTAIRRAQQGRRYVSSQLAQKMALADQDSGNPFEKLSPRELDTAIAIMHGVSGAPLARRLHISTKTVSAFRKRLLEKLDISSDAELIRMGIFHGLIPEAVLPSKHGFTPISAPKGQS